MMDELTPFSEGSVSLGSGTLVNPISSYIDSLLDEATDSVQLSAPATWRFPKKDFTGGASAALLEDGVTVYYTVALPDDFLRIAEVRMDGWERSVFSATLPDDEAYKLLRNPYTTPGRSKPSAALRGRQLELYGSRVAGRSLSVGQYLYKWYFPDVVVDRLVEDAICWRCAATALGVMGRHEAAAQAGRFYEDALLR
jgi:hypothetical protein